MVQMKAYCKLCKRETNHEILGEAVQKFNDEYEEIWAEDKYQIIKCMGCDNISYRTIGTFSEDYDPNTGGLTSTIHLYPKISEEDLEIKSLSSVPNKIRRIYRETIDSYNNECFTLCSAGLRAIIEGICAQENIKNGSIIIIKKDGTEKIVQAKDLQGKIAGLHEKNLLTKSNANILHEHRSLGNEAVHELDIPSKEELKLAIEIIEHTLENIYEIRSKAEDLQWKRALRKKKNSTEKVVMGLCQS